MSPIRVTAVRTIGLARNLFSTAFAVGSFLAVVAAAFVLRIVFSEGGSLPLTVLWAESVAPVLPALAAFLAMDVWSDERATGRIDLLLTVAVRERDFVLGKFLGVWLMAMASVAFFLLSSGVLLAVLAPQALSGVRLSSCLLAFLPLALQGALWCAVSVAFSAVFCHAASAACASLVFTVALSRGLWAGMMALSGAGRPLFGQMPLDEHVLDMASGVVPVGILLSYLAVTLGVLFVASKCVAAFRLSGRGARGLRITTGVTFVLTAVALGLALTLLHRLNPTVDLPVADLSATLSPRTRGILAECGGRLTVTCFLSRDDANFRSVVRLLRSLKRTSDAVGGVRLDLHYVDPSWDVGAAERLLRRGVSEASLVFEKDRRLIAVPLSEGVGERLCASTIRRLSSPSRRRHVYWTVGHGECAHGDYGLSGMSDIARELVREGFQNETIDLSAAQKIPGDCALILIAGAKDDFSRVEMGRLESYLREGGRIMILQNSAKAGGIVSMLPAWGMRPSDQPVAAEKSQTGTDVIVSGFADHPISASFKGSRIVMERPVSFSPSAVAEAGVDRLGEADRISFCPLATVGSAAVVAAVERGGGVRQDLAVRPMRVVAVGDAGFVMNGQLAVRANANRDFFLNCISYLSGNEAHGSGDEGGDVLRTGMDYATRLRHGVWSVAVLPLSVFLFMVFNVARRRRRS